MGDPLTTLLESEEIMGAIAPMIDGIFEPEENVAYKVYQTPQLNKVIQKLRVLNYKRVNTPLSFNIEDIKQYLFYIYQIMYILEHPRNKDGKCLFLGNGVNKGGCKIPGPLHPKLLKFYNVINILIFEFLLTLDNQTRLNIQLNKNVMEELTKIIKSLVYFVGGKTTEPIMPYFLDFFRDLNELFSDDLIVINCPGVPTESYTCGRFVQMFKCGSSNKFKIVIGRTESESNNRGHTGSSIKDGMVLGEQCGGKRKTRKTRKTKKHYKRTVKRKQSKRR